MTTYGKALAASLGLPEATLIWFDEVQERPACGLSDIYGILKTSDVHILIHSDGKTKATATAATQHENEARVCGFSWKCFMVEEGKIFITLYAASDALKNATASMKSSWPAAAAAALKASKKLQPAERRVVIEALNKQLVPLKKQQDDEL